MSSGKFSSMAAVLLLVALVCGTCASGAQAGFNLTLECGSPVVIRSEGAKSSYTLPPGKPIDVKKNGFHFFHPSVTVTLAKKRTPIKIPGERVVSENEEVQKMKIVCDKGQDFGCIYIYETYKIISLNFDVDTPVGRFCPSI